MDRRIGSECNEARTAAGSGSGSGSSDDRITALSLEVRAMIASLTEAAAARTAAGSSSGSSDDRITALPLELRALIASKLLSFEEAVQLTVLSRPWRHIHFHTPVVDINLFAFLSNFSDGEDALLALRVALGRRAQEASSSKVDTLNLICDIDDPRVWRHVARIIALADARVISLDSACDDATRNAWSLDLPHSARELHLSTSLLVPAIAGPSAAALRKLSLSWAVLTEWPRLPSLVSLDLFRVTVEAPFVPGAWCPLLQDLHLFCCDIRQARVDIRLQRLRSLHLDSVSVTTHSQASKAPYGVVTIDAPELIKFDMDSSCYKAKGTGTTDYKSFTLRAPRLRLLRWRSQYAERMVIDVGRPGSVRFGGITLMATSAFQMECLKEQMLQMLQGLLPNVQPENLDDVAKPYLTLRDWSDSDVPEDEDHKQLTCDLKGLIMSHEGYQKVVDGIYVSDKGVIEEEN